MAHFAKIDEQNRVLQVLTLDNKDMLNGDGVETESVGQQYLETHNNWPANMWIQTSYYTVKNQHVKGGTPLRGNYAAIGDIWDPTDEIFWSPQPYASWTKNLTTAMWDPPLSIPDMTQEQQDDPSNLYKHEWDEDTQSWSFVAYSAKP